MARELFARRREWGSDSPFWDELREGLSNGMFDREPEMQCFLLAIQATTEAAAKIARCHFDDRPYRDSMDWNDGYDAATRGAAEAILAHLKGNPHDSI